MNALRAALLGATSDPAAMSLAHYCRGLWTVCAAVAWSSTAIRSLDGVSTYGKALQASAGGANGAAEGSDAKRAAHGGAAAARPRRSSGADVASIANANKRKAVASSASAADGKATPGRLRTAVSRVLGRMTALLELRLPKRWFIHFYIAGSIVNAAALWALLRRTRAPSAHTAAAGASLPSGLWRLLQSPASAAPVMFQLHLLRRLCECILVHKWSATAQMPLSVYAGGMMHYIAAPLTTCFDSPAFRILAGGRATAAATRGWAPVALAGAVLFVAGSALQAHSHVLLSRMTRTRGADGALSYGIPAGGGFDWVSCPHYAGEVAVYAGLALVPAASAHGGNVGAWLLLVWVASNLAVTARKTHAWYKHTFGDAYPRERWALAPGLW